jgi:hypothetical protein
VNARPVGIRDARALCKTLGTRGVLIISIGKEDQLAGASYGTTMADCREMGGLLDRAYDALIEGRQPVSESVLARACRHALAHLEGIGWPEDAGLVAELRSVLSGRNDELGAPGVRDPDARCEMYAPGKPTNGGCQGDCHYLCAGCVHFAREEPA